MNNSKKINNSNPQYFNGKQIDVICSELTDMYTEKKLDEGTLITQIDIEDFVLKILGCTIAYENIAEDADCLGFLSDGLGSLPVIRNEKQISIVFPKDTIVIDKFLNDPNQSNLKRQIIAHEAGHVIKNRMCGTSVAEFNHAGGVELRSVDDFHKRLSFKESEANKFALSLLMPEGMVAMLMHKLYGDKKIAKHPDNTLDGRDAYRVSLMAKILGVSYTSMFIRLSNLGLIVDSE